MLIFSGFALLLDIWKIKECSQAFLPMASPWSACLAFCRLPFLYWWGESSQLWNSRYCITVVLTGSVLIWALVDRLCPCLINRTKEWSLLAERNKLRFMFLFWKWLTLRKSVQTECELSNYSVDNWLCAACCISIHMCKFGDLTTQAKHTYLPTVGENVHSGLY